MTTIDFEWLLAVVSVTSAAWCVHHAWRMRKLAREIKDLLRRRR